MRKFLAFIFIFIVQSFQAQPFQSRRLDSRGDSVQQWKTVEIGLRIPQLDNGYRTFLSDPSRGVNPYSQHNLWMQFNCNGKTYYTDVYYMQDAYADDSLNKYIAANSDWPWRTRFSVPDTGIWTAILLEGDDREHAVPQNTAITFHCVKGDSHGFLHIAADKRTLEYTDGTPFFIIGQNIPFTYAPILNGHVGKFPQYICGYNDIYHCINDLADNGGNFFRIVMSPWSTGIEWEQTGVYDQARAFALDSMLHLAEQRGLHVQISLDLSLGFDGIAGNDGEHPYIKSFLKPGMHACDLLDDSAALVAFDNYFRYVYARWLYSPTVVDIEMLCEQFHWDGYKGNEKKFDDFFTHIRKLMTDEFNDQYHLLSTSQIEGNASSRFKSDALDYVDIHQYTNDFVANERRFKLVNKRSVRSLDKPFLFGEMGMCNGPVNGCDANDFEYYSDISFHNALWATTFMGTMGTGLEWWQWENDTMRATNFPALEFFVDSVTNKMRGYNYPDMWTGNGLETFYTSNGISVAGWVHNRSYWWANTADSCIDRDGKHMIHPNDDDKAVAPESVIGNKFEVSGLRHRTYYIVTFYNTRDKTGSNTTSVLKSNYLGKLSLPMPVNTDCAFTIRLRIIVDF